MSTSSLERPQGVPAGVIVTRRGVVKVRWTPEARERLVALWDRDRRFKPQAEVIADALAPLLGARPSEAAMRKTLAAITGSEAIDPVIYTPDMLADIEIYYGLETAEAIANRFNESRGQLIGHTYTANGVILEARRRVGVNRHSTGHMMLAVLSDRLGVPRTSLYSAVKRLGIKGRRGSWFRYLDEKDVARLEAYFAPPPWRHLTSKEAAALLGCTSAAFRRHFVATNQVRYVRRGQRQLLVNAEDVEALRRRRAAS